MAVDAFVQTGDLTANERAIIDLVWRFGPVSRKSIAELSGLTGASATRLTRRALDLGLIEEQMVHSGAVGNPSRPLQRAQTGLYSLGVCFSQTVIEAALVDLNGVSVETTTADISSITVDDIAAFVRDFMKSSKTLGRHGRLLGVGIAVPGYRVEPPGHWALHWDFPHLLGLHLESELATRLQVPVHAERDAVAVAWAERLNGVSKTIQSFFLVYLAQGVGGALMVDGLPLLGKHGNAGGLGALFPYEQPRPSAHDLQQHLIRDAIDPAELDLDKPSHSESVDRWIEAVSPGMRTAVNLISRLYDPELIVIGGAIPSLVVNRLLAATDFSQVTPDYTVNLAPPEVRASHLLNDCVLAGAAALPIARLVSV